jgi:hypothetical protein
MDCPSRFFREYPSQSHGHIFWISGGRPTSAKGTRLWFLRKRPPFSTLISAKTSTITLHDHPDALGCHHVRLRRNSVLRSPAPPVPLSPRWRCSCDLSSPRLAGDEVEQWSDPKPAVPVRLQRHCMASPGIGDAVFRCEQVRQGGVRRARDGKPHLAGFRGKVMDGDHRVLPPGRHDCQDMRGSRSYHLRIAPSGAKTVTGLEACRHLVPVCPPERHAPPVRV